MSAVPEPRVRHERAPSADECADCSRANCDRGVMDCGCPCHLPKAAAEAEPPGRPGECDQCARDLYCEAELTCADVQAAYDRGARDLDAVRRERDDAITAAEKMAVVAGFARDSRDSAKAELAAARQELAAERAARQQAEAERVAELEARLDALRAEYTDLLAERDAMQCMLTQAGRAHKRLASKLRSIACDLDDGWVEP